MSEITPKGIPRLREVPLLREVSFLQPVPWLCQHFRVYLSYSVVLDSIKTSYFFVQFIQHFEAPFHALVVDTGASVHLLSTRPQPDFRSLNLDQVLMKVFNAAHARTHAFSALTTFNDSCRARCPGAVIVT
jgi:hypothetical protein